MPYVHKDTKSIGSRWWRHIDGASVSYPSDGAGGHTNTAGSSILASATKVFVTAILIDTTELNVETDIAAGHSEVVTLTDAAGAALTTFLVSASSTGRPGITFPGEGFEVDGGIGVSMTTVDADFCVVCYTERQDP